MSLFSFKFVLIIHIRPEFYENVNTNASESLQTSYDHYKCQWLAIGYKYVANGYKYVANMLSSQILGACF